ncbi:MAG: flagellar export protein FliJ [Calothrix sp. SM1_5_4]|nr:flagellar export protein FliJ [Calothrix sp. SM1_5_4]
MGFKFGLETVLKHRKRLEEIAQREFGEAQAAVEACLRELESMYNRMDEVRAEILDAQKVGSREKMEEVRGMEGFIDGQKIRIERQRLEARRLLSVAEEKQEALIEAAREKKILVKLKDKRLREYKEWLGRVEAKELDDMTMIRQARRAK